tara:strand:- start:75 stop:287 length:213 start_codon:yes stop_codon:yes gene_type:complete
MIPGIVSEDVVSEYFSIPWTRDDAQFPTPMIATLISPKFTFLPLFEPKMDASIFQQNTIRNCHEYGQFYL